MDYENKGHTDEEDDGDNDNIYDDQVVPTRPAAMDYDNKGGTNKEDDDEEDDNNYDDKVVFARAAAVDGFGAIEKTQTTMMTTLMTTWIMTRLSLPDQLRPR